VIANQIAEQPESGALTSRLTEIASNRMILSVAVAAAVPTLLMGLSLSVSRGRLLVWVAAALIGGWVFGFIVYRLSRPRFDSLLDAYVQTLESVVRGDLRQRLDVSILTARSNEERMLMRLGDAVNRMLDRLQDVVTEISDALQHINTDTEQILRATSLQISTANEQDAVVTETTATVNEVRATVTETAERAQSVAETAQVSVNISRTGTDAVQQTISGMELIRQRVEDIADNILVLSEHTQQIGEIIATVNNLADQSRMLALNASVEAARAGEEGKGFAVVALEVRNLADQNRDATIQVREILSEIQRATNAAVMVTEEGSKGVDHGQDLVNRAGGSIRDLAHAIEEAALAAMQIAASTRQQTIGMDQLTQAMRTIKQATSETLSSTTQVKASVQNLRDVTNRVNAVLSGLQL
jgi:methyl-accepting chemotaxis protein